MVRFLSSIDQFSVGFQVVRNYARFCQKTLNLPEFQHISKRSSWISTISHLISSNSSRISINRIANIDEPLLSMVNDDFPICRRSSQLKIGFSTSNLKMVGLPTDPPFSSFGGGDPSLTVTGVKSAGSWVWSDGLGRWASSQFCLDTPTLVAKTSLVVSSNWC